MTLIKYTYNKIGNPVNYKSIQVFFITLLNRFLAQQDYSEVFPEDPSRAILPLTTIADPQLIFQSFYIICPDIPYQFCTVVLGIELNEICS